MEIQIAYQHPMKNIDPVKVRMKLKRILRDLEYHDGELSLLFTDDKHMAELNHRFLKRQGPTNVLAFPMKDGHHSGPQTPMLGDIVISLDAARRDAKKGGEGLSRTIDRLIIHGLLHLLGYEHEGPQQEAQQMDEETERLLGIME